MRAPRHRPHDCLFQDPTYRQQHETRLEAWRNGEWYFLGIRARAAINIPYGSNPAGWITAELLSPGLRGVESDSGEDYCAQVYHEQRQILLEMLDSLKTCQLLVGRGLRQEQGKGGRGGCGLEHWVCLRKQELGVPDDVLSRQPGSPAPGLPLALADAETDPIDITPREYVLDYLSHSFPTQLFELFSDDEGNLHSRPAVDEDGNPVMSREAVERRDRMIEHLASLPRSETPLHRLARRTSWRSPSSSCWKRASKRPSPAAPKTSASRPSAPKASGSPSAAPSAPTLPRRALSGCAARSPWCARNAAPLKVAQRGFRE